MQHSIALLVESAHTTIDNGNILRCRFRSSGLDVLVDPVGSVGAVIGLNERCTQIRITSPGDAETMLFATGRIFTKVHADPARDLLRNEIRAETELL